MKKYVYLCLFLLCASSLFAQQEIRGTIIDAETKKPLEGVNIYIDGSSIGTISNNHGRFYLQTTQQVNASIIIQYLGYQTRNLPIKSSENRIDLGDIPLAHQPESIEEVFIETDPWTREKKLQYFREYFLGKDHQEKKCRILNEEDIRLKFSPSNGTLKAWCDVPIQVENKYLGYKITYNLANFLLLFKTNNTLEITHRQPIYYPYIANCSGSILFQELKKRVRRRYRKHREETYYGSVLHFMRSLASKTLEENEFRIFYEHFERPRYKYFEVEPLENQTKITWTTQRITIVYKDLGHQSFMQTAYPKQKSLHFYIDDYGNFYPLTSFYFGGVMGTQKVAAMLPLDYYPPKD